MWFKCISAEEVDENEDQNAQPPIKYSVFDRVQASTQGNAYPSSLKFREVKSHAQPKPSVFNRIMKGRELLNPPSQEQKDLVFNQLSDGNEVQSSIPSCMKQFSTLNVKRDGLLRVKRHTMVFAR